MLYYAIQINVIMLSNLSAISTLMLPIANAYICVMKDQCYDIYKWIMQVQMSIHVAKCCLIDTLYCAQS